MAGLAAEIAELDTAIGWYKFAGEIAQAARLAVRRTGDPDRIDTPRPDTLPRVYVRPAGRAVRRALTGTDTGDDLSDIYDPDSITRRFYHPVEEVARHAWVPVRNGTDWLDPPSPHRIQLIAGWKREHGRVVPRMREVICHTAEQLSALSETPEYRRSRFFETTGHWMRKAVSEADWQRYLARPLRESAGDVQASAAEHDRQREALEQFRQHGGSEADLNRLREDAFAMGEPGDTGGSGGFSVTADMDRQAFVPILGGPYHRQLYLYAHWEQTSKAFEAKNHSELCHLTIETVSDFCLGRGVSWKIRHPKVQQIWQEFWDRNTMEQRIRVLSDDRTWQGELVIRKDFPLKGFLRIRSMDPGSFYEQVCNPEDVEEIYLWHASFPTQYQLPYTSLTTSLGTAHLNVPLMRYVVHQYPPKEIFHLKANVSSTEKWGRSDFYASLGTIKRHRDWVNASTLKDLEQANLIWKIKLTGDDADVQAFLNDPSNAQLPAFGGTWVENQALTLDTVHADVAGSSRMGAGNTGAFLTALFAAGQQMPQSYFNNQTGTGAARATALVQGEPFVKKIGTRQQELRRLLDHLFEEVMVAAVDAGRIPADALRTADADPEWIFPSAYEEDRGAKFRDLALAYAVRSISHRTLSTQYGQELGLAEYDYDEEMLDVKKDVADPLLAPTYAAAVARPGASPAGGVPGAPPQTGQHEELTGADATHQFKQDMRNTPT